jgi:hypothetical protein
MSRFSAWSAAAVLLAAALLMPGTAAAHGIGMSQLRLRIDGAHIEGEWEIQLRDARRALGLDPTVAGEPGWREVRDRESQLRAYLAGRLSLTGDSLACPLELTPAPMEWQLLQSQVMFHLVAACPSEFKRLGIHCDFLFDLDPTHRAYFSVEDARVTSVGALDAGLRSVAFDVHQFHVLSTITEFIREGTHHIWTGFDHMLFLLALLLPAPLVRKGVDWSPRAGFWRTAREVTKVVTAFTLAHTLTLCLSFFGAVTLRAQWVEVGIAFSVFAAAWNNLRPFLPGRAWVMAMTFGLVHGLGFAGALSNLMLPRHARGLALASFNVGVELGQLAVVALMLPLLYGSSRRSWYPRLVMGAGSVVIAWLAVIWMLERGFSLSLFAHR